MKKFLLLFLTLGMLTACSSDDDNASSDKVTSIDITLEDANGEKLEGVVVYAYNENTWETIGEDTLFANFQAASGEDGVATFSNLTTDTTFNEITNYSQTFRFSAYYTAGGTDKIKTKAISFELGEDKSETIILD